MAKILIRALKLALPIRPTTPTNLIRQYASFTLREILTENPRQTGTLFLRLAKHVAINNRSCLELVPTTIRYADYFPVTDMRHFQEELQRTQPEQLPALINFAFTYRPSADPAVFATVLNKLDEVALKLLPKMSDETILNTLYAFLFLMPSWLNLLDFYRNSLQQIAQQYLSNTKMVTKDKFIQFCFYLGLDKKNSMAANEALQKVLKQQISKHLPEMSSMDLAIICNASFKAAIVLENNDFNERLQQEILMLNLEPAQVELFITFIKSLRLERAGSSEICQHLSKLSKDVKNLERLPVSGLTHLYAVFAENLWDEKASIQPIVDTFLHHLKDQVDNNKFRIHADSMRVKDLDKFLWCCAQLNYKLNEETLQKIECTLLNRVQYGSFNAFPDQLVDSCLSLWILGHKSRKLYEQTLQIKEQMTNKRYQPKVDSRLTVLHTAIGVEEPTWLDQLKNSSFKPFDLEKTAPAYLLKKRPDIVNYAERVKQEAGIKESKIVCVLQGINIPGIAVTFASKSEPIMVELITKDQTLRFNNDPTGIMRLKLHLLTVLQQKVVLLTEKQLANYTCLSDITSLNEEEDQSIEQSASNI